MKREDLLNTKWDIRKWTIQKRNDFLHRVEPLGFLWPEIPEHPKNVNFLYLEDSGVCYGYCDDNFRNIAGFVEKHYTDMFPEETPAPQFTQEDIIQYIVDQVEERKGVEDSEEDERGFEGLVLDTAHPAFSEETYILYLDTCSKEQEEFLIDEIKVNGLWDTYGNNQEEYNYLCFDEDGRVWCGFDENPRNMWDSWGVTSFNALFKYKEYL